MWSGSPLVGPDLTRAAAVAAAPANVWRAEAVPDYLARMARVRFSAEWLRPWRAGTLPSARLEEPVARLGATGIPILLLHGRQDMIFPASAAELVASRIAGARAVVLDDAGHMAHIDRPGPWLDAVAGFLADEFRAGGSS